MQREAELEWIRRFLEHLREGTTEPRILHSQPARRLLVPPHFGLKHGQVSGLPPCRNEPNGFILSTELLSAYA